ncbi:hypothetical protein GCM10009731_05580 [Streptomyces globosus]
MPDLVSPEKSSAVRFGAIQPFCAFRVTEQTSAIRPFAPFEQEGVLPVGSHNPTGSVRSVAARVLNNFLGGVLEGAVPCGGTRSEVLARRTGARGVIQAERTLSTGLPVQGRRVDDESLVLPAQGGVRFGVYTGPMTNMTSVRTESVAVVAAVGR